MLIFWLILIILMLFFAFLAGKLPAYPQNAVPKPPDLFADFVGDDYYVQLFLSNLPCGLDRSIDKEFVDYLLMLLKQERQKQPFEGFASPEQYIDFLTDKIVQGLQNQDLKGQQEQFKEYIDELSSRSCQSAFAHGQAEHTNPKVNIGQKSYTKPHAQINYPAHENAFWGQTTSCETPSQMATTYNGGDPWDKKYKTKDPWDKKAKPKDPWDKRFKNK